IDAIGRLSDPAMWTGLGTPRKHVSHDRLANPVWNGAALSPDRFRPGRAGRILGGQREDALRLRQLAGPLAIRGEHEMADRHVIPDDMLDEPRPPQEDGKD